MLLVDEVITVEPVKFMYFCRVFVTFKIYAEILASLVMCIHATFGLYRV